jgi:hypothetical protein
MSGLSERDAPRVFISHAGPQRDDARRLASLLRELGYEVQADPVSGGLVTQNLTEMLASADIVMALLGPGTLAPEIAYKLGLAKGLGKPALIVAPTGSILSLDVPDIQVVRSEVTNRYALRLALERALSTAPQEREGSELQRKSRALGAAADGLLKRAKTVSTEAQAVEILADALEQGGVTASAEAAIQGVDGPSRYRPDVAAWVEETRESHGNPVIFEVTSRATRPAIDQVRIYLDLAQARTGVVVRLDDSTPAVLWLGEMSRVVGVSLAWLIEQMRTQSIATILQQLADD